MTAAEKLIDIYEFKHDIKAALQAKGLIVTDDLNTYAGLIDSLVIAPVGGVIVIIGSSDVITLRPANASIKTVGDHDVRSWRNALGLIVEEGFEVIEQYACEGWSAATSLSLPNTLKTIGQNALAGWTSFTGTMIVPDSVTSIGANAFSGNTQMHGIKFGNGITSLTSSVLATASSLKTIDIGTGITSIAANMMSQGQQVTQIICRATTPPTLPSNYAFNGVPVSCVVKVPAASVDAYKAATGWSYWASTITAI